MNYLAHLALAQDSAHSRIGNLLGDFRKNVNINALPETIYLGLQNHYLVDRTTDQHHQILALKNHFSSQRRRFAGIIIDISFDYLLCKYWQTFTDEDFDDFTERCYCQLSEQFLDIPEPMQPAIKRMIQYDWLHAYHSLEGVERAIDRVAERIRFNNNLAGGVKEVEKNLPEIEQAFLDFYPDLQQTVSDAALEQER